MHSDRAVGIPMQPLIVLAAEYPGSDLIGQRLYLQSRRHGVNLPVPDALANGRSSV